MKNNVASFYTALQEGFEPRQYTYIAGQVPEGEYTAVLDKKIWAKKALGIGCYFTVTETGKKIQLTAFYRQAVGKYTLPQADIDFASCPVGKEYRIKVKQNDKGRIVFETAVIL